MRLIEADEILRELKNCRNELCLKCGEYTGEYLGNCDGCRYNRRNMAKWEELPTVDAVPVRHERWELVNEAGQRRYRCTYCQTLTWYAIYNYCPYCGAKMDLQEVDDAEKDL